jgi:chain length determinant protein EpsF
MTFRRMLAILLARKGLAAALLLLTLVVVMGITFALDKQYTATASVVADGRPDPLSNAISPSSFGLGFIATQADVLNSDRVMFKVIRALKLTENPDVRAQFQREEGGKGNIEVWLAESFRKRVEISPSRESNVISVSFSAQAPEFAAGMANAIVQAYIETTLELKVNPARQYAAFFEQRSTEARRALEAAQAKLSAFEKEHELLASDQRLDIETARLAELSSQLVQLQALSAESSSRRVAARSEGDRLQEVLNNPVIAGLKSDMARQQARLQELSARLGTAHPQVKEIQALIAELRQRVDAETSRVSASVGSQNDIQLRRDASVRAELDAQRAKVMRLKGLRDQGQVLTREVESAQRTFDAVIGRASTSSLEGQMTQSNISILQIAVPPNEPSSPRVGLNLILGILLGLLLAFIGVLLAEVMDARVRTAEDAVEVLDVPFLGAMLGGNAKPSKLSMLRLARR